MAITPFPEPTPAGVVGAACAGLGAVAGSLWSARGSGELVAGVKELQRLKATAAALEAELLTEIDVRGVAKRELGWGSTADWFTHLSGVTRRAGKRAVAHARLLVTERAATLEALREGVLSPEHAAVVVDAVERLPLAEHVRRRGEQLLIEEAGRLNATDLHRAGRHLARVVDPDGEERQAEGDLDREERAAHLRRFFSVTDDGCGGVRVKGRGSVEDGAVLRAALLPLTKPQPSVDPLTCEEQPDPRDHGARMWDALLGLAQHALDTDLPPMSHGARPPDRPHPPKHAGKLRVSCGTRVEGTLSRVSVLRPTRRGPDSTARRHDSTTASVLGTDSAVLDVGRDHRLVTAAIWTALVLRDPHCAFPGCTRPPVMCQAHHIRHWADGGATSLDNLVLVCGHHHRTLHHTPWQVRLADDGRPEFLPPARVGRPTPEWIRQRPRLE